VIRLKRRAISRTCSQTAWLRNSILVTDGPMTLIFYWFAAALVEVDRYPDDVAKWPVDLLVEIDAKVLKKTFINLSRDIMDRIKNT